MINEPIRVLVVDDYPIVRQGLINIIKDEKDVRVVGEAGSFDECLRVCRARHPDVVLLDTSLDETSIVTAIRLLTSQFHDLKIIAVADQSERNCAVLRGDSKCRNRGILSPGTNSDCVVHAIQAGARGAIRLSDAAGDLVKAIRTVHEGRHWIDGNSTARMMQSLFKSRSGSGTLLPEAGLTEREELICRMIADGMANKEIAMRLQIAQQTVKNHVSSILRKSGLEDRLQIARAVLLRAPCPTNEPADAQNVLDDPSHTESGSGL